MDAIVDGMTRHGIPGLKKGFEKAIDLMKQVAYDRSNPRPTVLIVGEYLLNFHPGANHDIEKYLETNGFEIIEARMTDVIRKTYFYMDAQIKEYHIHKPLGEKIWFRTADEVFNAAHAMTDSIAKRHPLYHRAARMQDIVQASDPIIHHTFDAGEGVLIPAEILHHAKKGCRNFIILQPFGCLPNHVVGRGVAKRLKEMYPDAQILCQPGEPSPDADYDRENQASGRRFRRPSHQHNPACAPGSRTSDQAGKTDFFRPPRQPHRRRCAGSIVILFRS